MSVIYVYAWVVFGIGIILAILSKVPPKNPVLIHRSIGFCFRNIRVGDGIGDLLALLAGLAILSSLLFK